MTGKWSISSEKEMTELAHDFYNSIRPGTVVTLNGNLGAGKTFFVKAFSKAAGAPSSSSPTFAIVNSYTGDYTIYHFDFYRIRNSAELRDIGIEEYLADPDAVSFIEWADLFPDVLPKHRLSIRIEETGATSREVVIESL